MSCLMWVLWKKHKYCFSKFFCSMSNLGGQNNVPYRCSGPDFETCEFAIIAKLALQTDYTGGQKGKVILDGLAGSCLSHGSLKREATSPTWRGLWWCKVREIFLVQLRTKGDATSQIMRKPDNEVRKGTETDPHPLSLLPEKSAVQPALHCQLC